MTIWQSILRPISQRLATLAGGYLSAFGMASDEVSTVQSAIPIVLGLGLDLVIRRFY